MRLSIYTSPFDPGGRKIMDTLRSNSGGWDATFQASLEDLESCLKTPRSDRKSSSWFPVTTGNWMS